VSFSKASQILELSEMVAAHRRGINHDDVMERFRCSLRTAQRMMSFLEYMYPNIVSYFDEEGRKRWRFQDDALQQRTLLNVKEVFILNLANMAFKINGSPYLSKNFSHIKEKVITGFPKYNNISSSDDEKELANVFSFAFYPHINEEFYSNIEDSIIHAINNSLIIEIDYGKTIKIQPYGILVGHNPRLVGLDIEGSNVKCFSLDKINNVVLTKKNFLRPKDFKLNEFSERLFYGADDDSDYEEVHWRFFGKSRERAKNYIFHPSQRVHVSADGYFHVKFKAAGQKYMCDFLIRWGEEVEIVSPISLKMKYDIAIKNVQ
jgi:predicted DNA-binding transcriptional regulator YafY